MNHTHFKSGIYLAALFTITTLTGCAGTSEVASENYQTPELKQTIAVTAAQLSITPEWFLNPPLTTANRGLIEVATAVNGDLQYALNIATLYTEQKLAKRINSEITSYEMSQIANAGGTNTQSSEQLIENTVSATALHGHQIIKREVFPDPKTGEFRVFVMAQIEPAAQANLLNEKIKRQNDEAENAMLKQYIEQLESTEKQSVDHS